MNDEIKEILVKLKEHLRCQKEVADVGSNVAYLRLTIGQYKLLLDYITNLQHENERLNYQLDLQKELTERNRLRKHCYKSRIEKAVGYLKKEKSNYMRSCDISNATNREGLIISSAVRTCDDTLNILNGKE